MFQSFAVIGAALAFVGLVYTLIFLRLILRNFKNNETVLSLSESLVTVFIGVFYLYSAIILARNGKPEIPAGNFTNTIDDVVIRNDTYETYYQAISITNPFSDSTNENKLENEEIEKNATRDPADVSYPINFGENSQQLLPEVSKADQFLINYQKFIRDMMKEKIVDSSISNQTFFPITNSTSKSRMRRDIEIEEETPYCYYEFFLQNALLVYSFVHCLITLLNKTLHCKKCISVHEDLASGVEAMKQKSDTETIWTTDDSRIEHDSNSEENEMSAPVGPLFETNEPSTSIDIPNLKLFEVKTTKSHASSRAETMQSPKQVPIQDEDVAQSYNYRFTLQILLMWILPVISVMILYCITRLQPSESFGYDLSFLSGINFTATQADPYLANIIEKPVNVSEANSTEVDQIIKNVYDIVGQVRENFTKKTTYFTPLMMDIVYHLKPNQRNPKDIENSCPSIDTSVKLFYFFLFVASYFGAILYAKIIQTSAEFKNVENAQHQKNCLMSFSILWLPSVLELFFRAYVSETKSSILTDLFLALGNTNRIYTMASNHFQSKKIFNKPNFVNPVI